MDIDDEDNSCSEIKDNGSVYEYTPWTKRTAGAVEPSSRTSRLHTTRKHPTERDKCFRKQLHSINSVVFSRKKSQIGNKCRSEHRRSRKEIANPKDRNQSKFLSNDYKKRNVVKKQNGRSQTSKRQNKCIIQYSGRDPQNSDIMCKNCSEKFQRKISLEWKPIEDMVTSQYRRECAVYPVYRCLVAGYFILVVISSAVVNNDDKIYIWFTYWALYLLTLSSILRSFTAWSYSLYWKDEDGMLYCKLMPVILKIQWILFNISTTITTIICIIYWVSVYDPEIGPTVISINTHGVNLILIVLDAFISHQPVRFLHFFHSTILCVLYAIFTLVYWAEGGTNHNNEPYIYAILDYSGNPVQAALYVCVVPLVAAPLCHSFFYFLYRLRTRFYRYCCIKSVKPRAQLDSTRDEKMLVMEVVSTV